MEKQDNNRQDNVRLMDIMGLLGNIFTVMAILSLDFIVAEYQGKGWWYRIVFSLIIVMIFVDICYLGRWLYHTKIGNRFYNVIYSIFKIIICKIKKNWLVCLIFVSIIVALSIGYLTRPSTEYYSSVVEWCGLPMGVGKPLSDEELKKCAFYWEIKDYPRQSRMVLTYVEPYQQVELMKKYSTVYNMGFFQPSARIEYKYRKNNKAKYHSYDSLDFYKAAEEHGYRDLEEVSYYSSSGKLLMRLKENDYDKYEIVTYSSVDMPQLLNSTLLYIPDSDRLISEDGTIAENDMTSQQIEVTYNSDGLPLTRKISSRINNLYGVNGEQYVYDKDNRLTTLYYLDNYGEPVCNKLGIMMVAFQYEENGRISSIRYFSDKNGTEKTEGFYGVFCEKFAYDENGNLIERKQLNRSENWCYDVNGVYMYRYDYNDDGMITNESFMGFNGKSVCNNKFNCRSIAFENRNNDNNRKILVSFDFVNVYAESVPEEDNKLDVEELWSEPDLLALTNQSDVKKNEKQFTSLEQSDKSIQKSDDSIKLENDKTVSQTNLKEEAEFANQYTSIRYNIGMDGSISSMSYLDATENPVLNDEGYSIKKFDYDGKKNITVENYCGIDGEICLVKDGYAKIENDYEDDINENSQIVCKKYLDLYGKPVINKKYGFASVEYERSEENREKTVKKKYLDENAKLVRLLGKNYMMIEQMYDKSGHLIRETYYDDADNPVNRADYGVAEIRYEYADDGNMIREWYGDGKGKYVNRTDTGYAVIYQEFENGQLIKKHYEEYQDEAFRSVSDKETGVSIIKYTYNNGHKQKEQYFDTMERPILRSDIGCASRWDEYDENGRISARYYYDADGQLVLRKDMGCAIVKYQYDELGRCNSYRYYGKDEEPVITLNYHCAGIEYKYDENGDATDSFYIGLDGRLMLRNDWGVARMRKEYDNGKLTETRYFDTNGNLIIRRDKGYAIVQYDYNEPDGKCISELYYDADEEPVISTEYCCAGFKYKYDENGNKTDTWYIGLDGGYMLRRDLGYAHASYQYDEYGNKVAASYFDIDGKPAVWKEGGCASCKFEYDENGNCKERQYFDIEGNLILRKDTGYAIAKYDYDEYGRCISELYYGTNKQPIISIKYNCAGFNYEYDKNGNRTEIWYIGLDNDLMVRKDLGYAHISCVYDDYGNEIAAYYYDDYENPTTWKEGGNTYCEFEYDEAGNCVEWRYFDAEEKPMLRLDKGYSIVKYKYDEIGRCISELYYDTKGKPVISSEYNCAGFKYKYDEMGNKSDTWYIGLDGRYMVRDDLGYAHIYYEYDKIGNIVAEYYFDNNEQPVACNEGGYAYCEFKYNEKGNCIEYSYFDDNDNLVLRNDTGYALMKYQYDELGQCTFISYYGINKEPVLHKEFHCAGFKYEYDERGNDKNTWYCGLDGELIEREDTGTVVHSWDYDEYDRVIMEAYYTFNPDDDSAMVLVVNKEWGYAVLEQTYQGINWAEMRYFDADYKPMVIKGFGLAVCKHEYNDDEQLIRESYYDEKGQLINAVPGWAIVEFEYDSSGNVEDCLYFNQDNVQLHL